MHFKKHLYYFVCVLCSAVLLIISWQPFQFSPAIFLGFVPLLFLEKKIRENKDHSGIYFFYISLTFLLWNAATTFWIWNATAFGAVAAFIINMIMMSLPWMFYHQMQKRTTEKKTEWIFIFAWIAFEYWHLNWDLSWPWLTLGNVFSTVPQIVQWYEYTGHIGGSLWILVVNIFIFRYLKTYNEKSTVLKFSRALNIIFFGIFAPILFSYFVQNKLTDETKLRKTIPKLNMLVVQPNIDPYTDKFGNMTPFDQTKKMLRIAEEKMDSTIQLVCFPETALQGSIDENRFEQNDCIQLVRDFIRKHPNVSILSGADTYKFYTDSTKRSLTARRYEGNEYYDVFNTAIFLDSSSKIQVYHKSVLVPGVEKMPFPKVFGFLEKFAVSLGGTSGSLGSDDEPSNFEIEKKINVSPIICYESVFAEYITRYVQKNSNLLCIITNDGWWGNTPGFRQHFDFARLRAIETRRYVARAANTGISGFIDDYGNIISESEWWKEAALKAQVNLNFEKTFYVKHGDYIAKICVALTLLSFVIYRKKIN